MGPSSLLKASRSIQTTLQSVSALMLACLTVFLTSAISPKQSPSRYQNTFLGSLVGVSFFSAMSLPSAMMQKRSPWSPCLTTQLPASYSSSRRVSQSCSFSQGSISASISTFESISEKYLRFLVAASWTMWLKVARSRPKSLPVALDLMEAARGALYMRASSPKKSPGWQVLRQVCLPPSTLQQSYSPWSMMQRVSPCSPSTITSWPASVCSSSMASMTMPKSSLLRLLKRMLFSMRALISCLVVASLGITLAAKSPFWLNCPKTSALMPCRLFFFSAFFFFFCSSLARNQAWASSLSSSESEWRSPVSLWSAWRNVYS